MKNGETSVIGGIIEEEDQSEYSEGALPGRSPRDRLSLQGHDRYENDKKELLIFITPQILEPVAMQ
ncbi:MAG: type II and III secretion system protein [Desulfobacterales bacterium]|nr:type II and III secretion system protein [Desulfobacterales bacterium]